MKLLRLMIAMPFILIAWPFIIFISVFMCFMEWLIEGNISDFFTRDLEISLRFPSYMYKKIISQKKPLVREGFKSNKNRGRPLDIENLE